MSRAPLPRPTPLTQGFWDAAARHQLVVQRCGACASLRHYPQLRCPACHSDQWAWHELTGRGVVHSFTITHQAFNASWVDRVPYAVATVELDDGVRMITDLPAPDTDAVTIGAPVEVFFDDLDEGITLPRFRLVR